MSIPAVTRVARLALLACWCALATSLIELGARGIETFALHRYIHLGRQIAWMTPLADLALFGSVAALLGLLSLAWPRMGSLPVIATVLAFFATLSVMTLQPWLAWWAVLCLSAGIALPIGHLAAAHDEVVTRFARRTLPGLAGVSLLVAGAMIGRLQLAERRALAALPPAPRNAPNVLLIVWDAVRAENLSLYGYPRSTTPNLEALARRGVAFERAMSTASWTSPGHASLFTGKWAHQVNTSWLAPLNGADSTLAEALASRGWRTAAFSGNLDVVNWEGGLLRGFSHTEDYTFSPGELARSSALLKWGLSFTAPRAALGWFDKPGRRYAQELNKAFFHWLDRDAERPYFAFINMFDAHDPYLPEAPYDTLFGWTAGAGPAERNRAKALAVSNAYAWSATEIASQQGRYDGAIAKMDRDLGLLLDELRRRNRLDNTVVVVTADHGEGFGEHGTFSHGDDAYLQVLHIPLVVVLPGRVPGGVRVSSLVSLRDVAATIAELTGTIGTAWPLPGRSLSRFFADTSRSAPDTVLAEVDRLPFGGQPWFPVRRGNVRTILALPYHLIATGDSLELFDIVADPAERQDLAALASLRTVRDSLATALRRWRRDPVASKP